MIGMVQAFVEHGLKYAQEALDLPRFQPPGQPDGPETKAMLEDLRRRAAAVLGKQALIKAPADAAPVDERQQGRSEVVREVAQPKGN